MILDILGVKKKGSDVTLEYKHRETEPLKKAWCRGFYLHKLESK